MQVRVLSDPLSTSNYAKALSEAMRPVAYIIARAMTDSSERWVRSMETVTVGRDRHPRACSFNPGKTLDFYSRVAGSNPAMPSGVYLLGADMNIHDVCTTLRSDHPGRKSYTPEYASPKNGFVYKQWIGGQQIISFHRYPIEHNNGKPIRNAP